ncbi:MAG: 50S ribosomal protein L32 [Candidatus Komeilibacteria bacterium]
MGLPSKKRSSSSKRRRAAHFALSNPARSKCAHCGHDTRPHFACKNCGFYRGREIVNTLKKSKSLTRSGKAAKATTSEK